MHAPAWGAHWNLVYSARELPGSDGMHHAALPDSPQVGTVLISAEVGYVDAMLAAFSQARRRAAGPLAAYASLVGAGVTASLVWPSSLFWLGPLILLPGLLGVLALGWATRVDFAKGGAGTPRIYYHLTESGVEIRRMGRSDWITWHELWDAVETGRSFLLCPSGADQYVIPKRCCSAGASVALRTVVGWAQQRSSGGRQAKKPATQ